MHVVMSNCFSSAYRCSRFRSLAHQGLSSFELPPVTYSSCCFEQPFVFGWRIWKQVRAHRNWDDRLLPDSGRAQPDQKDCEPTPSVPAFLCKCKVSCLTNPSARMAWRVPFCGNAKAIQVC